MVVAAPSLATLLVVFMLAGAAYALQQSLERAIAADLVPVEVRSTGFGALASANGVGDLISSAVVGALWTAVGPTAAFGYALALSVIGAIVTGVALRGGAGFQQTSRGRGLQSAVVSIAHARRHHSTHSAQRIVHIARATGNQVNVAMKDRLPGRQADVGADVKSRDRWIGGKNLIAQAPHEVVDGDHSSGRKSK